MTELHALPILIEGSGDFHANRYRVYFRPREGVRLSVRRLVDEFVDDFPAIFQGAFPGGTANIAVVTRMSGDRWNGHPPIKFTLEAYGPDAHDDWVGVQWSDPARGWAAQTLEVDSSAGRSILVGLLSTALGGPLAGGAASGFDFVNRKHFLAGRRSWVIADATDRLAGSHLRSRPGRPGEVFFLETAAVERFSSWVHDDLPAGDILTPGGTVADAINAIWLRLLENYVAFKSSDVVPLGAGVVDLTAPSPDWAVSGGVGVVRQVESFSSWREVRRRGWVAEALTLHPALSSQLPPFLAGPIDATLDRGNGKAYFFSGDHYYRYDIEEDRCDPGYPRPIRGGWGLPGDLDAAVGWGNGKAYLFKGSRYWRYDSGRDAIDPGYPKAISSGWPGLPDDLDAAVRWPNGKVYFFRGQQYWRWDPDSDSVDAGYPKAISAWKGLSGPISGAVVMGDKGWFFDGTRYSRYDIEDDRVDPGYPKPILGNW